MPRLRPVRHRLRGAQVRAGPAAGPRGRLHRPGQGLRGAGEVSLRREGSEHYQQCEVSRQQNQELKTLEYAVENTHDAEAEETETR